MHFLTTCLLCTAAVTSVVAQKWGDWLPHVSSKALQDLITEDDLLAGAQKLQDFADAANGTRVFASPGHNATVYWLQDYLSALDYYNVELQEQVHLYSGGETTLTVGDEVVPSEFFTYSPEGTLEAQLVAVDNLGCEAGDFPPEVEGNIALILRGECTFFLKGTNAGDAGAIGAVVYNNKAGFLAGTLGEESPDSVPIVGITQEAGEGLLALTEAGEVSATLAVDAIFQNRTTYNVIAETKGGDHDNVLALGAHTDSVQKGPGINDDGSGTIGILTVAAALTNFKVTNAVRFLFWTAEEFGLLGSAYYVSQLNQTETEIEKIRTYLNFDMIASPNYVYGIMDGDGSDFNITAPEGSSQIEATFEDFFTSAGVNFTSAPWANSSDYEAFFENSIPVGGLFTGAGEIKTEEEVELFGGEAEVAYDVNYHQAGDTVDNLAMDAFLLNTKAIANSVALYATSFDSLSARKPKLRRDPHTARNIIRKKRGMAHSHIVGCEHSRVTE